VPPIRREILVDTDPAAAFAVFTAGLGKWWPLGEHGVGGFRRPGGGAGRVRRGLRAGALTEDPRFGEHVAFLNRMREAGYLVLAGPLADADGEGMTVLRLPGPGRLGTATRLANEDDISVASGLPSARGWW
jgi:uncharacterized protein YciI